MALPPAGGADTLTFSYATTYYYTHDIALTYTQFLFKSIDSCPLYPSVLGLARPYDIIYAFLHHVTQSKQCCVTAKGPFY